MRRQPKGPGWRQRPSPAAQPSLEEPEQSGMEAQGEGPRRACAEQEAAQAHYFDLYDQAPVGYFTVNRRGMIEEANLTAAELLGVPRNALVNQPLSRFIHPEDKGRYHLRRRHPLKATQVLDLRLLTGAGSFWARLELRQMPDRDGGSGVFRVVLSDVGECKPGNLCLAGVLFDNACEGLMVADAKQRIVLVNRAFCRLSGYSEEEILGQTPRMFSSGRQNPAFYRAMWAEIEATGHWQGEIWNRRKNGEVYPQLVSISAARDEKGGQPAHYVAVFSDIGWLKDAAAKLEFLAHHDPLTGLPNRLLLSARLEHGLNVARRERKTLALLMLDLDRFKEVNDRFGHLAGDELLRQVAKRLTRRLRGIDTVTRLGGDEFTVLLEDLSHPKDAAQVATAIIEAIGKPWHLSNGAEVHIGVSVGISLFPEHGKTAGDLLQHADAALYQAKSEGRGVFKYFSDALGNAAFHRASLASPLRQAIAKGELRVHYQPQIEIASGRIVGAEALARWRHPTEGLILPGRFIPAAEEAGLIADIGAWVLEDVCRQGQRWIEAGLPPMTLSVNLSPQQFHHSDIAATVAQALGKTGFPAKHLELELGEGVLADREAETAAILGDLRSLGVRLAIDDFGTGYCSLAHLKRLPLDALKIDKSFIDDIPAQQDDKAIASAIVALGHALGLKVSAEGVETRAQLGFLENLGCDLWQGYFYSQAVPAEEFGALLQG